MISLVIAIAIILILIFAQQKGPNNTRQNSIERGHDAVESAREANRIIEGRLKIQTESVQ